VAEYWFRESKSWASSVERCPEVLPVLPTSPQLGLFGQRSVNIYSPLSSPQTCAGRFELPPPPSRCPVPTDESTMSTSSFFREPKETPFTIIGQDLCEKHHELRNLRETSRKKKTRRKIPKVLTFELRGQSQPVIQSELSFPRKSQLLAAQNAKKYSYNYFNHPI
jgi:hypothetical protein